MRLADDAFSVLRAVLQDSREEILKAFRLFDDDESGKISFKNLKRVAKELGENMTDEELQEMIDEGASQAYAHPHPRCTHPATAPTSHYVCWPACPAQPTATATARSTRRSFCVS